MPMFSGPCETPGQHPNAGEEDPRLGAGDCHRSALLRASRRTGTSETEPAAILRDGRFAPPQDEVCGIKLHPPDPIGFMESIYYGSLDKLRVFLDRLKN
jgi:hypothetical protein